MNEDDVRGAVFDVPLGGCAADFADLLVEIRIADPDGRLGRRPVVLVRREGRRPAVLERPILLDRRGRGRFIGWMPRDLDAITLMPEAGAMEEGQAPSLRIRRISYVEMGLIAALRAPGPLSRVLRLLIAGNTKGAAYRFARLFDGAITAPPYGAWVELQGAADARAADAIAAAWRDPPRLLISIEPGSARAVAETRVSLAAQDYPGVIEVEAGAPATWPSAEPGDLWLRLPAGARLASGAFWHLAHPFAADPEVRVVYGDEDRLGRAGNRCEPTFKSAWNPPLVVTGGMSSTGAVMRRATLPEGLDLAASPIEAVVLAVAGADRRSVVHVPRVLLHLAGPERLRAPQPSTTPRLADDTRPEVAVVIPTHDRADLLRACVEGLLHRTDGVTLDIVIVDNGSVEAATRALFEGWRNEPRIRVIAAPGPFNFAHLTNLGVAATRAETLLLLNNDIEPIGAGWLRAMVAELCDPQVGIVGARLLFPDGFVQHGGVTLGAGTIARHTFHFYALDGGEDRGLLSRRREVGCVTAACLLTRRSLWEAVGGMDEAGLAVAFNDVDYCLKVRALGHHIVWTPEATLIHRESVSRGADDTPEKLARFASEEAVMYDRWADALARDPFHNPNLSLVGEAFVLSSRPRDLTPRRSS